MSVSRNFRSRPILHLDMLQEENESVLEKVKYQLSSLYCEMSVINLCGVSINYFLIFLNSCEVMKKYARKLRQGARETSELRIY
jgi:hypothetical protein